MSSATRVMKLLMLGLVLSANLVASKANAREPVLVTSIEEASAIDLAVPASSFHSWAESEEEASRIVKEWASEPVTVPWTRVQLARHIKHKISPSRGARGLALVHVAMHDAFVHANGAGLDEKLAVSMAAARTLAYLFPTEEQAFDRIAFALAATLTDSRRDALPKQALAALELGAYIGGKTALRGQNDGAQYGWNGARLQWYGEGRVYGPGTWKPTGPYFYFPPDEPYAAGWATWALERADQFRPTPPMFGSARYLADLREVVAVNASLTDEQLRIAKFWVDGHGSVTPPGHWNQIAMEYALNVKLDDEVSTALFADLNMAMADAFIAAWDAKYFYWSTRPVTAAKLVLGVEYTPPILTPPFPGYVSGHASFSGTAAEVIGHYIPAQAAELHAMGEEAALSRLLGGIHFRHDNDDGLVLGRKIARAVIARGAPKATAEAVH